MPSTSDRTHASHASARLPRLTYWPDGDAIVVHNGDVWHNRPLYCDCRQMVIHAGEMPSLSSPMGTLYLGIARGQTRVMLHDFADRTARYRSGRMEWTLTDPRLIGMTVRLIATTLAGASGFATKLIVDGACTGDVAAWCFVTAKSAQTTTDIDSFAFDNVLGRFSPQVDKWMSLADATLTDIRNSLPNTPTEGVFATLPLHADEPQFLAVAADDTDTWIKRPLDPTAVADAQKAFDAGLARADTVAQRIVVDTPDAYFNAGVAASCAAIDGIFVDPAFAHGGSNWRFRFSGWRVMGGSTCYGWHDRIAKALAHFDAMQAKTDDGKLAPAPSVDGCEQAETSRFYGKGFVGYENCGPRSLYEFQSQFFDECVRDWRATADADFEKRLLPMLELHIERCKACYDPEDRGLYESFNNTWPSDSIWFNGGATPEESAYIYAACRAAADMRRRIGDDATAAKHTAEAEKILAAMNRVLWLDDKGHFASHIEQGGHRRIHDSAWVYAQHVPIESGITTPEQTWQAMYYTEWAMERFPLPYGGEMRQTSNWVPTKWSVRELYPGDNFAMALGYFLGGQGDDGWNLLRGTALQCMYGDPQVMPSYQGKDASGKNIIGAANLRSPGGLSHPDCAIDFSDLSTMFCRATVEGLFGYRPDYPNNIVRIAPTFPSTWPSALIRTTDFTLSYRQNGENEVYHVTLTKPATIAFRVPIRAKKIRSVTINGVEAKWSIEPWIGCGMLTANASCGTQAELVVELIDRVASSPCPTVEQSEGTPGHRLVLNKIDGDVPQYHATKVHVPDRRTSPALREAPTNARWQHIDLSQQLNGDIRTIFKQEYRSPRPNTVSMRIGYDGYSAWTFKHWDIVAPTISLDRIGEPIITPQHASFAPLHAQKNIAFTSLWDNWPTSVTVPINACGKALWLMICGSTNPMQCRIANAVVRFTYADGVQETLELVPPFNYWSLCHFGGADYDYKRDSFSLPKDPPPQAQLGENCRAMVYGWPMRAGVILRDVTLETLSQEVVVGLMGVSIMNP